jgi:putative ABC transport system permease protein
MLSNSLVALSGALLCQYQRHADLDYGNGMLVAGLASVIIGLALFNKWSVSWGVIAAVVGSIFYRMIIQAAYQIDMPSYMVKLLSALIVVLALSFPLIKAKLAVLRQQHKSKEEDLA